MSFFLEEECSVPFDFDYVELAGQAVSFCLEHEGFPYEAEVDLTLTDIEGIRRMNKQFRQIDSPTDVLSFPMLHFDEPGDFSFLERESDEDFNPDTGEAMLGDIVICVDKVLEQAQSYGHSPRREFAFLIVHSILHLFGYDHSKPQEADIMEAKQREILEAMNILR